ncbi:class IV adenylate cyclase [Kitasatospora sp. NPDC006786]|uniref:class IV adenylate cyclase n=1 Tax=unclassified Kitasatospora TaxID=2633591 RepID=UPI0033CC138F
MKYTEVEQKFKLLSDPQELRDQLAARGGKAGQPTRQVDHYYNAPHKDFLAGDVISEWLRVRIEDDGGASLNFKRWHPLEEKIKTHCDEYETTVSDATAAQHILDSLDFTELTTVDKTREEWSVDGIAVAFDNLGDLGDFIEFEYKGDAESIEEATAKIESFIAGLDIKLGDRIHAGYPHLALGLV